MNEGMEIDFQVQVHYQEVWNKMRIWEIGISSVIIMYMCMGLQYDSHIFFKHRQERYRSAQLIKMTNLCFGWLEKRFFFPYTLKLTGHPS